jgi:hypothetical protein
VVSHKPPTATESTGPSEGLGGRAGSLTLRGILVGQDVRDVGDVVEKFTAAPPGCPGGNLPQRNVIVGVGPPSTSIEFRAAV